MVDWACDYCDGVGGDPAGLVCEACRGFGVGCIRTGGEHVWVHWGSKVPGLERSGYYCSICHLGDMP